jgi:glycosyltransferase involved in cell wall biosynthesis
MYIGIVTPVYVPAPGGGAEYTRLLAESLAAREDVQAVSVFTEAFPGMPSWERNSAGKIEVHRIFPYRAGRPRRDVSSFIDYGLQNIMFAQVSHWIPPELDVLLVHASLHYNPNLIGFGLDMLRRKRGGGLLLILDVRDPIMPRAAKRAVGRYDRLICCSQSGLMHLTGRLKVGKPVQLIPFPFERRVPNANCVATALRKHGLESVRFLLSTNGTSREKGAELCLHIAERLRARGHDLMLAIAGRRRNWNAIFGRAEAAGWLRHLGVLNRDELLALMMSCAIHLNPSAIESISRSSLEAISLGARVLLPSNTPEFDECASAFVTSSADPGRLTDQVERILLAEKGQVNYPFQRHDPTRVAASYVELFKRSAI